MLSAELEDAGAPSGAVGTLVSSLVDFASPAGQVDNVTDVDSGALLGIAITAADTTNGSWFYSTNNGATWNTLGAVTNASALLLAADANTRTYFQPNADWNGTLGSAITFRAWDQTSGSNGGTADTSTNGGSSAFSTTTDTASLTITAVNDAPTNAVPAAQTAPAAGSLVFSSGNGNAITVGDVDGGALTVTLSIGGGTLTLSGTSGLSVTGDGTGTVTLAGSIANINAALEGLTYGAPGSAGSQTLTITTSDGVASDVDTVSITVTAQPPQIDLDADDSSSGPVSASDNFSSNTYTGASGGVIPWAGPWIEPVDDGGTSQSPADGDTRIEYLDLGSGFSYVLSLGDPTGTGGGTPASAERAIDLSSYTNASLSFALSTSGNVDPSEYV